MPYSGSGVRYLPRRRLARSSRLSFVDVERGSFVSEELELTPGELSGLDLDLEADDEAEVSDDDGGAF